MGTTEVSITTTADAPFNDPTDCVDLVIRTVDNVDFFVLSGLLSLKSPSSFFRQVLQGGHHTEERDSFPILEVKEDGETFRIILLLCYPYAPPKIKSVEQLVAVGKALDKYCMAHAWKRFVQTVITSSLIKEQALRIFARAVANGWKELGEAAAKNTLNIPLDSEVELEDLRCIDALQYVRLRDYHRRCGKAALAAMSGKQIRMPWLKGYASELRFLRSDLACCRVCGRQQQAIKVDQTLYYAHSWFFHYLATVKTGALLRPCSEIALDDDIIFQAAMSSISDCSPAEWTNIASEQIRQFAKLLTREVDRLISQVTLNIEWTK
ncbi:hypothetical protein ARMSODRAFT_1011523 [Armillaria solidipes]|uniref:BTB domain-containing protein n=1 Tax=Armillaria solidipes TaxID=1076256 RepID=A0A2H3CD29_9AGAR|nr:hypothetical protein ARMSODRAFT_1011523 [Armillaria solidipes]